MRSLTPRAATDPRPSASCTAAAAGGRTRGWQRILGVSLVLLLLAACAEPPHKEMDQAQGAIDAARAAGADRYAAEELTGAVDTLRLAHDAVADGDYRLALNYALESRERAQTAAREAAETGARIRSEVERALADTEASLAQAETRLAEVSPKLPRQAREDAAAALARIRTDLQEAGTAAAAGDYLAAQPRLDGAIARIDEVMARADDALPSQSSRSR